MFDRSWTILLNAANQSELVEVALPGGDPKFVMEAMLGGNSSSGNVVIFEGQLSLAEALAKLTPGQVDAIMVVPPGGVGRCKSPGPNVFTVVSDTVIPAQQSILVTVRLRQIYAPYTP